ncbi:MAG: dicarboxylate/amino acid:cation symporter [Parvularculaceae bacterium]
MLRTLRSLVLVFLAAGIATGAFLQSLGNETLNNAAEVVQAFGAVWLNGLRMTVAPLVFALLVAAVASVASAVATGRLAARAVLLFTGLLFFAGIYAVIASKGLLAIWPVDPAAAEAFLAGAAQSGVEPARLAGFSDWLQSLVPANVFRAAAEDAILPLTVFAILFGFAATRLAPEPRALIVNIFSAISEAMVVIIHWILAFAPFGVFALALGVGLNVGFGAAGLLAQYAIFVSLCIIGVIAFAYLFAVMFGRVGVLRFAAAIAPAQVVAASTQSSIATLPAMLEVARGPLGVPKRVADIILPMAVAVFRFTSPVGNLAVCFFVAALYGFEPSLLQIVGAIFVAYAISIAAVGLPGQVSFITSVAPICAALGLPTEVLGILIAVEVVPDIFRTIGNVTGDLMAATILKREAAGEATPNPADAPADALA